MAPLPQTPQSGPGGRANASVVKGSYTNASMGSGFLYKRLIGEGRSYKRLIGGREKVTELTVKVERLKHPLVSEPTSCSATG